MPNPTRKIEILTPGTFLIAHSPYKAFGFQRNEYLDKFVGPETDGKDFDAYTPLRLTIGSFSHTQETYTYEVVDLQEIEEYCESFGKLYKANDMWRDFIRSTTGRMIEAGVVLNVDYVKDENSQTISPSSLMDIARHMQDSNYIWSGRMCLSIPGSSLYVAFDWDDTWEEVQAAIRQVQADPENVQFDQL